MTAAHDALRMRLVEAGLERHADALVALASPSVRLRSGEAVSRPPAPPRHVAMPVPGIDSAVAIGSSKRHRVALLADGTLRAWGFNVSGQLGDGTKLDRPAPVIVRDLADVRAIAVGGGHALALTAGGAVYAWGGNGSGQIGDGTMEDRRRPVAVPGLERGVRSVAAGIRSSFAWLDDGTVLGWGDWVLAGVVDPPRHRSRPLPIDELRGVVAIAGGWHHLLALTADGVVLAWGSNLSLNLGVQIDGYHRAAPEPVPGLPRIAAIAGGESHSLALDEVGTVHGWGGNLFCERGDASRGADRAEPRALHGPRAARAIAAGNHLSLALGRDGRAVAWGLNHDRVLGDPDERVSRHASAPVAGLGDDVVAIAVGLALRADGTVMQWGDGLPTGAPAWDDGLPVGRAKLGGRPDLPKGTRWPRADGRPMTFLAQVALADVAPLDTTASLPAAGHMAVFWDPESPDMTTWRVLYSGAGELVRPPPPRGAPPELDGAVALDPDPEPELTPCPATSEPVRRLGLSAQERLVYRNLLELGQGRLHRMLGHPDVVQNDPRAGRHELLLLQLDLAEGTVFKHGDGRMYWFVAASDVAQGRLDRGRGVYQQT